MVKDLSRSQLNLFVLKYNDSTINKHVRAWPLAVAVNGKGW